MYCRDSCWCVQRVSAERGAERERPNRVQRYRTRGYVLSRIWRLEIAHGVMPLSKSRFFWTGRVQTGVAQKLSILKQCSKLAPCARLSRPQASQPRLDYSAHPP